MNQNSKQTHKNGCFLQTLMLMIRSKNVLIEMSHMDKMLLLEGTYNDVFLSGTKNNYLDIVFLIEIGVPLDQQ